MSDLGNREVFSNNLKRYMEAWNLNRADIAAIVDCPYTTVNDWYNAKTYPRIDMIEKLANHFGIVKADLIESTSKTVTPKRKYLMDRIAKASDDQLKKLDKLWDIIAEEDERNI